MTNQELRRAERAVERGGAPARITYAHLLERAGHRADEVLQTLLPALDQATVRAELRSMAKEKRSLGVSKATIDQIVPHVKHAEVQQYLIAYASQGKVQANEMLDCLVHSKGGVGFSPEGHKIELACRKTLGLSMFKVVTTASESRNGYSNLVHEVVDRRTGKRIMKFNGMVGEPTTKSDPPVLVSGDVDIELDPDGRHVVVHEANGNTRRVQIGKQRRRP